MPLALIVAAFVVVAMYVRRRFGGGALAALWAVTTAAMASSSSAMFLQTIRRVGSSASDAGRTITIAGMLVLMGASFGAATVAIHRRDAGGGPWLTLPGFILAIVWYIVGGAATTAIAAIGWFLYVARMAP